MKVCVYGAGVVGGVLASAIQRGGQPVSIIARGAHLDAIRRNGLTIRTPERSETTRHEATDDPATLGPQDLVIVAAKTPALQQVARDIGPLLHEGTLVAFCVNGVFWFYGDGFAPGGVALDMRRLDPDGLLHARIGAHRAIGMISIGGGEIREPGIVDAARFDLKFIAGAAMAETRDAAARVLDALTPADIELERVDDIRRAMWLKYMNVVGNFATCALTGATIGGVQTNPPTQAVQLALTGEAVAVARAHGFDMPWELERARANPVRSPHKPSMLQDLERGRLMEVESAYLILQDLARQAGVPTPALDIVAPLLALRARTAGCA
jgi:2-dehydropantoate 2-reductase